MIVNCDKNDFMEADEQHLLLNAIVKHHHYLICTKGAIWNLKDYPWDSFLLCFIQKDKYYRHCKF